MPDRRLIALLQDLLREEVEATVAKVRVGDVDPATGKDHDTHPAAREDIARLQREAIMAAIAITGGEDVSDVLDTMLLRLTPIADMARTPRQPHDGTNWGRLAAAHEAAIRRVEKLCAERKVLVLELELHPNDFQNAAEVYAEAESLLAAGIIQDHWMDVGTFVLASARMETRR